VRYDVTQPYVEINVSPDLPPIEYLKYTSDSRMIVASESGFFFITDGITNTIEEIRESQTSLRIYPNPTSDILHIQSENDIKHIDIMDSQGRSVYVSKRADLVDISSWNTGVYIMSVVLDDGQRVTRKVIKM
jgi:hypothetical protein